jgi:hypothetical protein
LYTTHHSCEYEFQCEENEVTTSACGGDRETDLGHEFEKVHSSSFDPLTGLFGVFTKIQGYYSTGKRKFDYNQKIR